MAQILLNNHVTIFLLYFIWSFLHFPFSPNKPSQPEDIQLQRRDRAAEKAAGIGVNNPRHSSRCFETCLKMSQRHPETFTQATVHAELILRPYN